MGKFNYEVKDISLAPKGLEKIEWAYRNMPVLRAIEAELIEKQPFAGMNAGRSSCRPCFFRYHERICRSRR